MKPGLRPILTSEKLARLREWRARPRGQRPNLHIVADQLGVSYSTAKRGASGRDAYAKRETVS